MVGLFTFNDSGNEIDIEFTHWNQKWYWENNSYYTNQPGATSGNSINFNMTLTQSERWELCLGILDFCKRNADEENNTMLTSEQIVAWLSSTMGISPLCVRKQIRLYIDTNMVIQRTNNCPVLNLNGNNLINEIKLAQQARAQAQQNKA